MAILSRLTLSRRCFWINIESQSIFEHQVVVDKLKQDTRVTVLGHVQVCLLSCLWFSSILVFRGEEPPRLSTGSWVAGWGRRQFWRSWMPLLTRPPVSSGSVWSHFVPSKCVEKSFNGASSCLHPMLLSLAWTAMLLSGFLWWHAWKKLRYLWNNRIGRNDSIGTQAVTKAMEAKNWELAVQLRGKSFQRNLETYRMLTRCRSTCSK